MGILSGGMTFKHGKNVRGLAQMKTREGQPLQVQNINYLLLLNQNQQIFSLPSAIKVTVDKLWTHAMVTMKTCGL